MSAVEDKKRADEYQANAPGSGGGGCSTTIIILAVVAVVVVLIGAVGAGVGVALSNDDGNNVAINFDNSEFDLFEFLAICSQLEGAGVLVEDNDYYDGVGTLIGIQTCFNGHSIRCDGFFDEDNTGIHCPTVVRGDCQCEEGSINLLFSESNVFACDVNLEGEVFDFLDEYYEDFGACVELDNQFDADDLLALADVDDFTAGDLDGSLDVLNTLLEDCIGQQDALNEDDIADGGYYYDNETTFESLFNSCINSNMRFTCDSFFYSLVVEPCNFAPGELFDDEDIGGIEEINFDNAEFNLFEFFSICNNLESTGLFQPDEDYNDDVGVLNGIQTCYNGLEVNCFLLFQDDPVFDSFGFHCPTSFAGDCGCEEGSINLLSSVSDTFACEVNTGEEVEDYFENYYANVGECDALNNEFDANDLLDVDFANNLADNDVDGTLQIFNQVLNQCMSTQSRFDEVNGTFTGEVFSSCISSSLRFECGEIGYGILNEPCDNPPGDIFDEGGNYYYAKRSQGTGRIFG